MESQQAFSWSRMLSAGSRAFAINLMLVMGLHILPPVAFLCPLGTGFVTGWNLKATRLEAMIIGAVMGCWMLLICGLVTLGLIVASAIRPPGIVASDMLGLSLIVSLIVAHLVVFAGAGAMLGGHFARAEQVSANPTST